MRMRRRNHRTPEQACFGAPRAGIESATPAFGALPVHNLSFDLKPYATLNPQNHDQPRRIKGPKRAQTVIPLRDARTTWPSDTGDRTCTTSS
ncbi:hypothetical protein BCEP27_100163 [Burkholderia cepacia]